jgi:hypothetical protein
MNASRGNSRIRIRAVAARSWPEIKTAIRSHGSGLRLLEYVGDDTGDGFRRRSLPLQQVTVQFGIGKFQYCLESPFFVLAGGRVSGIEVTNQEIIKFAHTPAALPAKTRRFSQLEFPFDQHFLGLSDRLCRVEPLGTGLRAIHDGVATIQSKRIFEFVQTFPGRLVTAVD